MNHVRILFSPRLGSEAMELFDEKRERERERETCSTQGTILNYQTMYLIIDTLYTFNVLGMNKNMSDLLFYV